MEASALQAPAGLARPRISVTAPLLRLRSDDQLLTLFRAGNEDAFRVIHDRYRQRLFAYTRQMLAGSTQDAEDALQDVFVRAYSGLRADDRQLTVRPWLYRVAHNRCIDELRRPLPPPPAVLYQACVQTHDPIARVEQRESLRRLVADLRRLPAQQRSALLMRELGGMSYAHVATAMDVSVPAVKSLLVRARIGLTMASEARDTACVEICDEIAVAHDRGVRSSGTVRRHLADCGGCRQFQSQLRGSRRQFAALAPTLGPLGLVAQLLGIGGGGAGGAGAAATGGATATTGVVLGGGTVASAGTFAAGATHVATLIAAAVVTAGGAVAIDHSIAPTHHRPPAREPALVAPRPQPAAPPLYQAEPYRVPVTPAAPSRSTKPAVAKATTPGTAGGAASSTGAPTSVSGGDNIVPTALPPTGTTNSTGTGTPTQTSTGTSSATGTNGSAGAGGTTGTSPGGATSSTGTANPSSGTSAGSGTTGSTGAGSSTPTGTGATGSTGTGSGTTTPPPAGSTSGTPPAGS